MIHIHGNEVIITSKVGVPVLLRPLLVGVTLRDRWKSTRAWLSHYLIAHLKATTHQLAYGQVCVCVCMCVCACIYAEQHILFVCYAVLTPRRE